jgi:PAS domain S-box-containing protein
MNRFRLLVVSDSDDLRARYRALFELAGYEVTGAETAGECIRTIVANPPDLVLLDIGSPDMSALDIYREIKGDKCSAGVLVLQLSGGKASSNSHLEDLEDGPDGYLTKPVEDRTLLTHVNALLRIKRSEEAVRRTERAIQEAHEQLENKVLQRTAELMAANTFLRQEIAERKRIEEALVAVTTEWEQTFDAVPDYVCITDLQGKILKANRAMRNRFEAQHGSLVGLDYRTCYCGTASPEPPPPWTAVLSGGPPSLTETTLPALPGSFFVASYPLFDAKGEQWGALSAVRDVTEQRRTQEALEAAQEKYRQIFENAIEGIFQSTPDGRFISANPALARMFGYDSPEEFISDRRNIELQHYVDPEQRKVFKNLVEEKGFVRAFELQAYRKDGTIIWTSENVRAVRDDAGAILYYEGIVEDVTRRKEVEVERLELLRRLVRAQEDEQRRISRELHDQMGQSLAALLLGLKSVKDTAPDDLLRIEIQRLQDITNRMANDMHSLISELRPPALDDLGLHTAVSDYIHEWSERTNIAVDFHVNGLLDQRLDSQLESTIYRIVQEALNNVMKHAGAQSVSVIFEKRGHRMSIIVEDDGIGFDVEALMKTPAKNRRFGLLGMRERVMLVGGSVNIESTPGMGTTILVHIDTSRNLGRQNE